MSLSRAFTTRKVQMSTEIASERKSLQRSSTTRGGAQPIRHKISAPMQLVHTTNMLSYNAPDLPRSSRSNSTATSKSDEDSDSRVTAESTPPTSPDVPPTDRCSSPEPNHLTSYFNAAMGMASESPQANVPAIPQRSPSHTKKNSYGAMARQRSISQMSKESHGSVSTKASYTFSRASSTSTRASSTSQTSPFQAAKQAAPPVPAPLSSMPPSVSTTAASPRAMKESHPFGQELAQVTELAEEYATKTQLKTIYEDEQYIETKGLIKHCASEYLSDIQSLSTMFFPELSPMASPTPLWI